MQATSFCASKTRWFWLLLVLLEACNASTAGHAPPLMAANSAAGVQAPAPAAAGANSGGPPATGGSLPMPPAVASGTATAAGPAAAPAGKSGAATLGPTAGGYAPSVANGGSPAAGNAGASGKPAITAGSPAAATGAANDCSKRFTTAMHVTLDMTWPETIGTMAGSGTLHVWAKTTYTASGDTWTSEARACGLVMPPLTTQPLLDALKLGYDFPTRSFDNPAMPTFVGSSIRQNGKWLMNPGALMLGTTLPDPDEPWPSRQSLMLVDHDGDGKPAITVTTLQGDGFVSPPTDITLSSVADQTYVASRIKLRITAPDLGCAGRVEASVEPMGFDFTPVGCHVKDGGECPASAANLYNRYLPKLMLGATGKAILLPIAEQASCADIRAALPNAE